MSLPSLRTGPRVLLSFAFILVVLVSITAISLLSLQSARDMADELVNGALARQHAATELAGVVELNGTRAIAVARSDSLELADYFEAQIALGDRRIAELGKLAGAGEAQDARAKAYFEARKEVFRLKSIGRTLDVETQVERSMAPAQEAWLASLRALAQSEGALAADKAAAAAQLYRDNRLLLVSLGLFAIVAAVLLGWRLTRSVVQPLQAAVRHAQRVAQGDLYVSHASVRADEFGELQAALASMSEQLAGTVAQVHAAVGRIDGAAHDLTDDNAALAERTARQAEAVRQTADDMRALTEAVERNAAHARRADALAGANAMLAGQGGEDIARVAGTMDSIKASSARIADIVGVMDSIAFQTNILALNAAVEAARSGEHGRGFGVVASEVRTLAQRSAAAAREIATLIGQSVQQVDAGAEYVRQAGRTMQEIVQSSGQVASGVREIAAAGEGQGKGIARVGTAILQIDRDTRENAALVAQAAQAAEGLKQEAAALTDAMAFFSAGHVPAGAEVVDLISYRTSSRPSSPDLAATDGILQYVPRTAGTGDDRDSWRESA